MAELRLAGLEVFRLDAVDAYRPRLLRICQGLGRFYSSKFTAEGHRPDWDRAGIYFERAMLQQDAPSSALLKDIGVHLVQLEVKDLDSFDSLPEAAKLQLLDLRQQAERMFNESLARRPEDVKLDPDLATWIAGNTDLAMNLLS